MNCLSINIRGIGGNGKANWINKIKVDCGVSFVGLQESMCSNVSPGVISNYWGGIGAEFESVDAVGNSGGIVSFWDPKVFSRDKVIKDINFLCISGILTEGLVRINVLNVYAPHNNEDKRGLWQKIVNLIQSIEGWWIVFGDFNVVRDLDERKNSVFDPVGARDFNDFIEDAGLREHQLKGMKFICMTVRQGQCKLSKIDRFFVCDGIFNSWSNVCVRVLKKGLSDHSPIIFSVVDFNFGAKPFCWFDSWLDKPGCEDIVRSVFSGWTNRGPSDLNLLNKMKKLQAALSNWYRSWSILERQNEASLRVDKEKMEILMENKGLEEEEFWIWSECSKCLEEIQLRKNRDLKQKSRVKWASLGDENSNFFHNVVNGRKARNGIPGLMVNGGWVSKP
ncbi:uncharacterized protein LOC110906513 [Helianthus annuus]|uniref:uncharacterized protein LOC110906513 n=1 Tax=Helianthus annuus TaxID=4232 RepID=UPI000B8FEC49|nr:uncharacterized protein LOC110906513 [Helianthus annuus]